MTTSIISITDYFGKWYHNEDVTAEVLANASTFLPKVNDLLQDAIDHGVSLTINPNTQNYVAGQTYGGFRPQNCPQGASNSSHKVGRGVDVLDVTNALDTWLDGFEQGFGINSKLKEFGLCREAPSATISWVHLSDRFPPSGKDTFNP